MLIASRAFLILPVIQISLLVEFSLFHYLQAIFFIIVCVYCSISARSFEKKDNVIVYGLIMWIPIFWGSLAYYIAAGLPDQNIAFVTFKVIFSLCWPLIITLSAWYFVNDEKKIQRVRN